MLTLQSIVEYLGNFLTRIILAIIVVLIGFIAGKIIGRLTHKFLQEAELNKLAKKLGIKINIQETISKIAEYIIYFIAIILGIEQLGITLTILYIISGGVLILIIVAIFLGVKDFVPNLIAGITIYRKEKIKEGQKIKFKNVEGKVEKIELLETKIKTKTGDTLIIPNSLLLKEELTIKKK